MNSGGPVNPLHVMILCHEGPSSIHLIIGPPTGKVSLNPTERDEQAAGLKGTLTSLLSILTIKLVEQARVEYRPLHGKTKILLIMLRDLLLLPQTEDSEMQML